jgi:hypothetical protein
MIEEILPVDNNTNSYVKANVGGLKKVEDVLVVIFNFLLEKNAM